jgi:hypothetical protein
MIPSFLEDYGMPEAEQEMFRSILLPERAAA